MLENLLEDPRFDPLALVRSESSGKKLMKSVEGCGLERIVVCDVTQLKNSETPPPVEGIESMIICTSAVPVVSKRSLVSVLLRIPLNLVRRKKLVDFRALRFRFKANQYPEIVDYEGQLAQIDLAKAIGCKHVVIVRYGYSSIV